MRTKKIEVPIVLESEVLHAPNDRTGVGAPDGDRSAGLSCSKAPDRRGRPSVGRPKRYSLIAVGDAVADQHRRQSNGTVMSVIERIGF